MRSVLFILLLGAVSIARAEPGFAGLTQGPHPVGYRVVQQYHHSRAYKDKIDVVSGAPSVGERARPIQTLAWYPAQKGGAPVSYEDYVRTEASDDEFDRSASQVAAFMAGRHKDAAARIGPAPAKAALGQRMWAVRGANPQAGKFPVVIYAPGGGAAAHEAADLGEYLENNRDVPAAIASYRRALELDPKNANAAARLAALAGAASAPAPAVSGGR